MLKLDKSANEKDKLIELVKVALTKKTYELEAIIGNNNSFDLNSKTDLIKIIKRIKGKNPYTKLTQKDSLLIFIDNPKYSKEISRIIVKGNAINQYCNQENIEHILNSVEFEKKIRVNKEERLYLQNYGIRFNLKEETMVSKDMPIVRELLKDWTNLPKSFRLKKTFQFEHEDGDFNIDLSGNVNLDLDLELDEQLEGGLDGELDGELRGIRERTMHPCFRSEPEAGPNDKTCCCTSAGSCDTMAGRRAHGTSSSGTELRPSSAQVISPGEEQSSLIRLELEMGELVSPGTSTSKCGVSVPPNKAFLKECSADGQTPSAGDSENGRGK